jgi:hypothetical protein
MVASVLKRKHTCMIRVYSLMMKYTAEIWGISSTKCMFCHVKYEIYTESRSMHTYCNINGSYIFCHLKSVNTLFDDCKLYILHWIKKEVYIYFIWYLKKYILHLMKHTRCSIYLKNASSVLSFLGSAYTAFLHIWSNVYCTKITRV